MSHSLILEVEQSNFKNEEKTEKPTIQSKKAVVPSKNVNLLPLLHFTICSYLRNNI